MQLTAIILETFSFFLVTIDLYGRTRLEAARGRLHGTVQELSQAWANPPSRAGAILRAVISVNFHWRWTLEKSLAFYAWLLQPARFENKLIVAGALLFIMARVLTVAAL